MAEFKYTGTTWTDQSWIHEEILEQINSGNACYHSGKMFRSVVLRFESVKTETWKYIILYVCMCVCETWSGAKALSWIEMLYSRVIQRNVTYRFVTMTYMGKITNIYKEVSIVRIYRTQHYVSEATCFRPRAKTLILRNTSPNFMFYWPCISIIV
jgi:hypothetical protein